MPQFSARNEFRNFKRALSVAQKAPPNSESLAAVVSAPILITQPSVSGLSPVGSVLTSTTGTWTNTPTTYAYAWLRDATVIAGATAATYTTVAADKGHEVSPRVTATNATGSSSPAFSHNAILVS
jgi:hypothetical protein